MNIRYLKPLVKLICLSAALLCTNTLWAQTESVQIKNTQKSTEEILNKSQKTNFPKEAVLRYEGPLGSTALMKFNQIDDQYQASLRFNLLAYSMNFSSSGHIKDQKIFPEQYTDTRRSKPYSNANFDYETQTIRFGKASEDLKEEPIQGTPQDYLSLIWQLALNKDSLNQPIQITNGKTVSIQDKITSTQETTLTINNQKMRVQLFKIDKENGGLEFVLAPDFANVPVQITLLNNSMRNTFYLVSITLDGKDYWQSTANHNERQKTNEPK